MKFKAISGIMLTLLLIGMLTLAFNIQQLKAEPGTIYIRADGSVDPPTPLIQRDGNVYTFTGNINASIVVERDNIVIDGAGYTVQGPGSGRGIDLSGRSNVTIKNIKIKAFYYGIVLDDSSNYNTISGNNITNNSGGIYLYYSSNNTISGNNITNNSGGIYLTVSGYNSISGNNIANNNGYGISLRECHRNSISENNITNNCGIFLYYSSNNTISGNNITNNGYSGIHLTMSDYNTFSGNNITNNDHGIFLTVSGHNSISGNNIANNKGYGVFLFLSSSFNSISENNITNNKGGIYTHYSSNHCIHHNNFIDNTRQVHDYSWIYPDLPPSIPDRPPSINTWDDGYPSGGNYWSDYAGVDLYSGPYQNETGSDGIGDTPYVIDADNQDNYPLMNPWTPISWEYVFEDERRGTTLKISTDDKYFQFIAPDKTFSVKHDPDMIATAHFIFISYEDSELKLITLAVDTKLDFCFAYAKDMQTGQIYWLVDWLWRHRS